MSEIKTPEIPGVHLPESVGFKQIKPDRLTGEGARAFWNERFDRNEVDEQKLKEALANYIEEIRQYSDMPETIPCSPIDVTDLRYVSPEENASNREQFNEFKKDLKNQWEEANGRPWPKYTEDVYIVCSGGREVKIREAGQDYDAHHIHPLGLGGRNEASNLTPLRADVHFDSRGVHKEGSPYDQLNKILEGGY